MQIRKSKLKQIIQEEIDNAKFIEVREGSFFDDETALKDPATQLGGDSDVSDVDDVRLDLTELVVQEITKALDGLGEGHEADGFKRQLDRASMEMSIEKLQLMINNHLADVDDLGMMSWFHAANEKGTEIQLHNLLSLIKSLKNLSKKIKTG